MAIRRPAPGVVVPVLVCLALGGLGGLGTALVTKPEAQAQPARYTVPRQPPPTFRLRDEEGTWRTPASARGDVLVVTFIYTRCRDLCPRQAAEIKDAVLGAGGGVQVYAITVDPEHDDPAAARAWLKRMGVAGGPVHILLGSRAELEPVWNRFGIVPIAQSPREEIAESEEYGESYEEHDEGYEEAGEEYEEYGEDAEEHSAAYEEAERQETLEHRPAPKAALDEYPAVGDGNYRGHARHEGGLDYEHSAYALLIDPRGRQRIGYPYEQITSDLMLTDLQALKAEP
jgi:cytochrome oxidase Cu insertion factor (SCO1/SenC/PrrC family)